MDKKYVDAVFDLTQKKFFEIFSKDIKIECLETGFRFVEGPVWFNETQTLLFSDIPGNALYLWNEKEGLKLFRQNSYLANGNTLDMQGKLLTCEHGTSRLTRTDLSTGSYSVLASHFEGRELNSPNDVVCKSDGNIYFTDPIPGRQPRVGIPRPVGQPFRGVFRYDDKTASLMLLDDKLTTPNGLCFSEDEENLFVNDSATGEIFKYTLNERGLLINKKLWARISADGEGCADGMKIMPNGFILCSGPGGVFLFDNNGYLMGRIKFPEVVANFTFANNYSELYLTATSSIYRICLK